MTCKCTEKHLLRSSIRMRATRTAARASARATAGSVRILVFLLFLCIRCKLCCLRLGDEIIWLSVFDIETGVEYYSIRRGEA